MTSAKTAAEKQREVNIACGLSVLPSTGPFQMQRPFGVEPTPNYWEIVSADYSNSGFSISGYIHDDDARILSAAKDMLEVLREYVRDFGDNEDADSQRMAAKARAALSKAGV